MSPPLDLSRHARTKTIELGTIGRRSGKPRSVTIWFVVDGPDAILVQHVAAKPANWYRNLRDNPKVTVDFGEGPLAGEATCLTDRREIESVVTRVGKKYWLYRVVRFFGGGLEDAVAARIVLEPHD